VFVVLNLAGISGLARSPRKIGLPPFTQRTRKPGASIRNSISSPRPSTGCTCSFRSRTCGGLFQDSKDFGHGQSIFQFLPEKFLNVSILMGPSKASFKMFQTIR